MFLKSRIFESNFFTGLIGGAAMRTMIRNIIAILDQEPRNKLLKLKIRRTTLFVRSIG